ncbi:MAG: Mbeg1-like protein [Oscillospiraceae bacterium]
MPAELQKDRLLAAYNNDGPGFAHDMLDTPEYRRVADKLHTYIPESSIVGVLLEHAEDYAVIDSSNRSIMQHEPLSWNVVGTRFVHLGQRSQMGKLSDDVLRQWIGSMTPPEREQFTDALFDVLRSVRQGPDAGRPPQRRSGRRRGAAEAVQRRG